MALSLPVLNEFPQDVLVLGVLLCHLGMDYLTDLARCDLRGHLDYVERNLIEKWFQTLAMRIDRFHQTWMDGSASAQRWLAAFVYYYNFQRPNQALDNRTSVQELQNR